MQHPTTRKKWLIIFGIIVVVLAAGCVGLQLSFDANDRSIMAKLAPPLEQLPAISHCSKGNVEGPGAMFTPARASATYTCTNGATLSQVHTTLVDYFKARNYTIADDDTLHYHESIAGQGTYAPGFRAVAAQQSLGISFINPAETEGHDIGSLPVERVEIANFQ